jgi:predicted ArsR family transcriptional regulator
MFSGRGETQQQLLRALQREPHGLNVEMLSKQLEVTVTAVRQHLAALGRDGLVVKVASAPSGGRPAHVYALSESAREAFPRQYSWFSETLLGELRSRLGRAGLERTLRALGEKAAGAAPDGDTPLDARAEALVGKMTELGYDGFVVSSKRGTVDIAARNCVFHQLAAKNPEVCQFDLGLIGTATSAAVSHDECIVRGGKVCRFKLAAKKRG